MEDSIIIANGNNNIILNTADKFFHSNLYIALTTFVGIIGFTFKLEIYAIYVLAIIAAISWVTCKDLLPSFIIMMMIAMTPLARYDDGGYFDNLYYLLIPIGLAIIARPFIFRPQGLPFGEFFIPTLAVSVAITLGGLFHFSFRDSFTMPALYYVFGLGFAQLLINFVLESNIQKNVDHTIFLSKMMVGVGVMGICMVLVTYIKNFEHLFGDLSLFASFFQWGNNLSNNLLISMPFTFYLACKQQKFSTFYFVVGLLQYIAIIMGLSRGGFIFATLVLPIAVAASIVCSKNNRKKFILATAVFVAAIITVCIILLPQVKVLINGLEFVSNEVRILLYAYAWKNFVNNPIFGTGLGFNPRIYYSPQPMCIYWYHSTLFQILGSLGLVGLIAYAIQAFYRGRALLKVKSRFNLFVFIAILGFGGYSMINVGYFVPLPNMAALLTIFIIIDRNNKYLRKNPLLLQQEIVRLKKKKTI